MAKKKIELVNGMDQSNLEDAVLAAIEKRIGAPVAVFESANYGVVAIERLTGRDADRVDWDEVAAELARTTGVGVTCVANCDWTFDDRPDEEATYVAFACPGVEAAGYAHDEYRDLLSDDYDPATAPSQQDFDNLKKAQRIVKEYLIELDGRRGKLIAAGKSDAAPTDEMVDVEELKKLLVTERDAVKAVLELDFARAIALSAKEPEAPAPGM